MNNIILGEYTLTITSPGCKAYSSVVSLDSIMTVNALLMPFMPPPRNFFVDNMTMYASWNEPLALLLNEDFEGGVSPPAGWQVSSQEEGWFKSIDGSSSSWTIPPHTAYAVANDDLARPANNGCYDYLITPELDLTGAPSYNEFPELL